MRKSLPLKISYTSGDCTAHHSSPKKKKSGQQTPVKKYQLLTRGATATRMFPTA
jgi:hypothetical protein